LIPVKDVMSKDVVTFRADAPVEEVARTLRKLRITGAPVIDSSGSVVGIVSEVDVFGRKGKTAAEIMSPNVISVTVDTGIDEAAQILAGERIRRLPVMDGGKMVGLVSRSDVLDFFATAQWVCTTCGQPERGLQPPRLCEYCQGQEFRLERGDPGS
jgi:CBS domain-containing protein